MLSQMIALNLCQCPKVLLPACLGQPDMMIQTAYTAQKEILGSTCAQPASYSPLCFVFHNPNRTTGLMGATIVYVSSFPKYLSVRHSTGYSNTLRRRSRGKQIYCEFEFNVDFVKLLKSCSFERVRFGRLLEKKITCRKEVWLYCFHRTAG